MRDARSNLLIFVVISFLVVGLIYSSVPKSYVVFAAVTYGPISCSVSNNAEKLHCCQISTDDAGIEMEWCTSCDNTVKGPANCSERYQPGHGVAPPPASTGACPDPNQALGATGNCAPLTQTPEAPVPKSGPGNLLPEGVFEGPTTSPGIDCTTNPTDPSCQPTELTPQVDCAQTPNDPLCETAVAPETAPTELTPQVDCAQTPNDPLCETATIPGGGEEGAGEDSSGSGGDEAEGGDSSDGGNNPDEG